MLSAVLHKRLGSFALSATLQVEPGTVLVLVGESGAGKTSILRLLAGLDHPDQGQIVLDGQAYFDHQRGLAVAPWERAIGYLAQDYALFPHLSVADNIAFGLRARGLARRTALARATAILEQLGIAKLADRRPHQLSGGQRQRVALARALIIGPRLLLLDEPLSALDRQTRRAVGQELRRTLTGLSCVTLYVTHDPNEALTFGDRIAVVEHGRITQNDSTASLLRQPRSGYAADLLGVNLLRGTISPDAPGTATTEWGRIAVESAEHGEVWIAINPQQIRLSVDGTADSTRSGVPGTINTMTPEPPMGERIRVILATTPPLIAEIPSQAAAALGLREGLAVRASFDPGDAIVYR